MAASRAIRLPRPTGHAAESIARVRVTRIVEEGRLRAGGLRARHCVPRVARRAIVLECLVVLRCKQKQQGKEHVEEPHWLMEVWSRWKGAWDSSQVVP